MQDNLFFPHSSLADTAWKMDFRAQTFVPGTTDAAATGTLSNAVWTTSSLPPPRDLVSNYRKGTPRSRGGCVTCKARHLKCDETKPCCKRCEASIQKCEYIAPPPRKSNPPPPINPARTRHVNPVIIIPYQPSVDIPGDHAERRSFHYIQARNLTETFGRCEMDLWDTTMLLYSHSSSAVRSSMLALSAIYEVHERKIMMNDRTAISLGSLQKHAFSLYTKAVAEIIQSLRANTKGRKSDRRSVLLSCLIFCWVEIMLSNLETTRWHLDSGIKIINDIATNPAEISEREDPGDVYGSLHRSFLRLKFQTTVGLQAVPMIAPPPTKTPPPKQPNPLISRQPNPTQVPTTNTLGQQASSGPNMELTWTLQGRLRQIERLRLADEAIQNMPASSIREDDRKRSLTYVYVKLSRAVLSLMTQARSNGPGSLDDSRYAELLDIIQDIYERKKLLPAPTISLDFGMNPPLLFTLRWCNGKEIKRRAFNLLKFGARREGLWYRDDIIAIVEQEGLLRDI